MYAPLPLVAAIGRGEVMRSRGTLGLVERYALVTATRANALGGVRRDRRGIVAVQAELELCES